MSWRSEARGALRAYPRIISRRGEQQITPAYGGVAVQHSASRTTEAAALRGRLSEREERIVAAVELALEMQRHYHNAAERLLMVRLVYWRRTHTLEGAAVETHYSVEAVKRWNSEILTAVYVGLKRTQKSVPFFEAKS